jgi:hypothetical protein
MIFRRRRTRIEIEHTTVRMDADDLNSVALRPVAMTPAAPSPTKSALARVLPFRTAEPAEPIATPPAKETLR